MKLLSTLATVALFAASAPIAAAQTTPAYSVICTEVGPKLVTPADSVGITLDTARLGEQLHELDTQLEEVHLAEYELKLLRQKRTLLAQREQLTAVIDKARAACSPPE